MRLPGSPPGRPPPTHTLGLDLPRSRGVCVGEHRAGSQSAPCGPARGAVALWLARQHGVTSVGPGKPGPLFSVLMTQPSVSPQGCCGALACGPGETRRNRGWPALAEGARRLIQSSESACELGGKMRGEWSRPAGALESSLLGSVQPGNLQDLQDLPGLGHKPLACSLTRSTPSGPPGTWEGYWGSHCPASSLWSGAKCQFSVNPAW